MRIGCTPGTGVQMVRQLAILETRVRSFARDPVKARSLAPAGMEMPGDVMDPASRFAGPGWRQPSGPAWPGSNYQPQMVKSGFSRDERTFNRFFKKSDGSVASPVDEVVRPAHATSCC